MNRSLTLVLAGVCLLGVVSISRAADWMGQGGDAGMTKYSSDNIVVGDLQQVYKKRFYSKWTDWTESYGAYQYACDVMVRNGQAIVLTNDAPDTAGIYGPLFWTQFDWATGQTVYKSTMPGTPDGGANWFHGGENPAEIDTNHFNFPAVWADDGRVYARRGGDQRCQGALTVATHSWQYLPSDKPITAWAGDAMAYITAYKGNVIYRPGHLGDAYNYAVGDISAASWAAGIPGQSVYWAGNGEGLTYPTDMPKCGANKLIVCYDKTTYSPSYTSQTTVAATDLTTHQLAWKKSFPTQDTYTGQGTDTLQYVATEDGYYAMSYRTPTAQTIYVLNSSDGSERFTYQMGNKAERPLMAYANGALYVIGKNEQLKLDITDGHVIWRQTNAFVNDANYAYNDTTYRPMVLTNDSLWFVDRGNGTAGSDDRLIGINTGSGAIFQTMDLTQLVGQTSTDQLIHVQDLVAANGKLGVFIDVKNTAGSHNTSNSIAYQDLYVFGLSLPGDADGNGKVDFNDYLTLRLNFGSTGMTWRDGDFNGDGVVTFKDYIILESHFGKDAATNVPEPATASLLLAGLGLLAGRRRARA